MSVVDARVIDGPIGIGESGISRGGGDGQFANSVSA